MPETTPSAPPLPRALEFLRTRTNFEQVDRRAGARLDLAPVRALLDRLGRPEERFAVIHVAGTKGKGSVCWMLDAVLRRAGVRCGRYLSPHLERIEERIAIDGVPLSADAFGEAVLAVAPHVGDTGATFFDVLTAAAFAAFARADVAYAVVEVGLGGRLDSTNATPKVSSAVTAIGLEHVEVLGDDVAGIAREKAAIARRGVPLFSSNADATPVGRAIATAAREIGAPLIVAGREFAARNVRPDGAGLRVDVETVRRAYIDLRLPTAARYQVENLALAVAMLDDLEARELVTGVRHALEHPPDPDAGDLCVPGRFEVVARAAGAAQIVLDGAHTAESIAAALDSLDAAVPGRPRVVVLGVSKDKDLSRLSSAMAGRADMVLATASTNPRAAEPASVAEAAARVGLRAKGVANLEEALEEAKREAGSEGVVLVTGSLYLVGEARSRLVGEARGRLRS
ncbi:MAG TPA: cyanophycin synthetase [Planctomycetota bacterium]|nr:cyanophycin synthetase [Planctomycetota bacterium]